LGHRLLPFAWFLLLVLLFIEMSKVLASDRDSGKVDSETKNSQHHGEAVSSKVEQGTHSSQDRNSIPISTSTGEQRIRRGQDSSIQKDETTVGEYQDTGLVENTSENNSSNNNLLNISTEQQQQQVHTQPPSDNTFTAAQRDEKEQEIAEQPEAICTDFIQVPKEAVGFIIGKGGETIKELSIKSGAHIEVERRDIDTSSSTRLFRIQGTRNNIALAKQLVLEKVAGVLVGQNVSTSVASSIGSIQSELWIPMDRVGVIIGVGGQTIKLLEEQSQTTIVVHNDKVNAVGEKLVTIVGKPSQVHLAETLIRDMLTQRPSRAITSPPATLYSTVVMGQTSYPGLVPPAELSSYMSSTNFITNKTIFVPRKSIGMIIGKRGETIRDLQYRSGASIRVVPDSEVSDNSVERPIILSGSLESVELAHNLINDIVNEGIERVGGDISETLYPSASISLRIQIPNDKVGWIIGKGGSTIRELQQRSGARIQVSKPSETDTRTNTRPVTITGPPPFVEIAKQLVNEKLAGYYMRQGGSGTKERRYQQDSSLLSSAYAAVPPPPATPSSSTHPLHYTFEMNPFASSFDPTMYYPFYGMMYPPPTAAAASSFPAVSNLTRSQTHSPDGHQVSEPIASQQLPPFSSI